MIVTSVFFLVVVLVLYLVHWVLIFLTPPLRRVSAPVPPIPPLAARKDSKDKNTEDNIVVVGGSGFLGKTIVRQLVERGEKNVVVFDMVKGNIPSVKYVVGSIAEEDKMVDTLTNAKIVFHTASIMEFNNFSRSFAVNVVGTQHVINACIRAGVPRLVYTSTAVVLMDGTDLFDADEEHYSYSKTHVTCYGTTKMLAEKLVLAANGSKGLRTCALRPCALFGPGDALIGNVMAKNNQVGVGPVQQDYMFIENTAHSHIVAGDELTDKSRVAGNYYYISLSGEFMFKLAAAIGHKNTKIIPKPLYCILPAFHFGGGYFSGFVFDNVNIGIMRFVYTNLTYSTKKFVQDTGYKPLYTLEEGIKLTGEYYKQLLAGKT